MLYRLLLRCFPASFRARHGAAMAAQFKAQRAAVRGRPTAIARLWLRAGADAIHHGLGARLAAGREHRLRSSRWLAPGEWVLDTRLALRLLWRQPGFSAVACLTLALGIGATAAVFSVLDAALFRPLPYRDADRLVHVFLSANTVSGDQVWIYTGGRFGDRLRSIPGVFEAVSAHTRGTVEALAQGGGPVKVGGLVPGFAGFLDVRPVLGRSFHPDDTEAGGVAVISDRYWRRQFDRDPDVLGRSIPLAAGSLTIVGVMPPDFRFIVGVETDVWRPVAEADADAVICRLRPGLTVEAAQREVDAAIGRPDAAWKPQGLQVTAIDWNRANDRSATRTMLFVLLGAVACLLLIACANVANMLLARSASRRREVAVRTALGAARGALLRMFVAEGLVIAAVGGVAALGVAAMGIALLPRLVPAELTNAILGVVPPRLDPRVLAAGLAATAVSAIVCAALPAWRATRGSATASLTSADRAGGATRHQRWLSSLFQAVQVGLTVVLLSGAGLMTSALARMAMTSPGFDPAGLAYLSVDFPRDMPFEARFAASDALVDRIKQLPGAVAAAAGPAPVSGSVGGELSVLAAGDFDTRAALVESFSVGEGYFATTGIRLVVGRLFTAAEHADDLPVALVSDRTAERVWPGASPLGQRIRLYEDSEHSYGFTVVGVVTHTRSLQVARNSVQVYQPSRRQGQIVFRLREDAVATFADVAALVASVGNGAVPRRLGSVSNLFAEYDPLGPSRFYSELIGAFAGIGLVTAAVGLFGLLANSVGRRRREIGIRVALGARATAIARQVVADALVPVLAGTAAGLFGSWWLSSMLVARVPALRANDPAALAGVILVLLLATTAAALVPVRRALGVDPAVALRAE